MKQRVMTVLMTAILLAALAGCGQQEELRETQRQLEQAATSGGEDPMITYSKMKADKMGGK